MGRRHTDICAGFVGALDRTGGGNSTAVGGAPRELAVANGRLGYEDVPVYEGSSYAAMYLAGLGIRAVLSRAAPESSTVSGASVISRLRSALTGYEVDRVRLAATSPVRHFGSGAGQLRQAPGSRKLPRRLPRI